MARPTWKGYLGFGLVQLPVELFPATQEDDVDLTMLDRRNMSPVGYRRYNKKTNKEVAHALSVSVNTVETHRKHIMEKLDLHNTAELVRFAIRTKIVH